MDTYTWRAWKRLTASLTSVVLVALSVVVPLLDGNRGIDGPVLETEHHDSTCVVVHDHTICTQVGANLALAPPDPGSPRAPLRLRLRRAPGADVPAVHAPYAAHFPRAPPSIRA